MKKIVLISQYGATPDMPGATKNYEFTEYIATLENHIAEYWICGISHYTGERHKSLKRMKLTATENSSKHKTIRINSIKYRNNKFLRQLNATIFDIIVAFKILFSKDISNVLVVTPPTSLFTIYATKIKKINLTAIVEDLWPLFLIDMGLNNALAIKYMDFASKILYKNANNITAVSERMLTYVDDNYRHKSGNLWVSPLGVNLEEYTNISININDFKKFRWYGDFIVMYLGAHGRANDLLSVLETIDDFNEKYTKRFSKKISFVFVGDGDQKETIVEYAKNNNIRNVYFEDAVSSNDVPKYLSIADVCLTNLMKIESFKMVRPNKLFQYMALKKPIISGIEGEFSEIIEITNSGRYIDFTKNNSAQNLFEFLTSKSLKEMGENGFNYVLKNGDRKVIFEDFIKRI